MTRLAYHWYAAALMRAVKTVEPESAPHEKLKQLILDGELAVGEPFVERTLARRLGVSRKPVREAIFRLEREGLVSVIEGKGAFVASYTIDDLIEIYQVREGLEPARSAAQLPPPAR